MKGQSYINPKILDKNSVSWRGPWRIDMYNNNRKSIQEDILYDAGKFVELDSRKKGILIGALEDGYDFYWIVLTTERELCVSSCVGGYKIMEDIPLECSVLKWMQDNDMESLVEIAKDKLVPYIKYGDKIMCGLWLDEKR